MTSHLNEYINMFQSLKRSNNSYAMHGHYLTYSDKTKENIGIKLKIQKQHKSLQEIEKKNIYELCVVFLIRCTHATWFWFV